MADLVTVTWNPEDIADQPVSGSVTFKLSGVVTDTATGNVYMPYPPRRYEFLGVPGQSDPLIANDSEDLSPAGSYYTVTIGAGSTVTYNVVLSAANGDTQSLGSLIANAAQPAAQYAQYLPLPSGTPAPGEIPVATGNGTQTEWGASSGGTGAVSSVNGQTGTVTLAASDVGAATGADITSAVQAETTRAEGAEALALARASNLSDVANAATALGNLGGAPKASPILTGTPTAPTAAAGTANNQIANTSFVAAAIGTPLRLVATTGAAGAALANGTPAILTWTAPNDGQLHRIQLISNGYVTAAMTGGAVTLNTVLPNGQAGNPVIYAGGTANPGPLASSVLRLVEPGSTVTLTQSSALTAGAATVWAELWAS